MKKLILTLSAELGDDLTQDEIAGLCVLQRNLTWLLEHHFDRIEVASGCAPGNPKIMCYFDPHDKGFDFPFSLDSLVGKQVTFQQMNQVTEYGKRIIREFLPTINDAVVSGDQNSTDSIMSQTENHDSEAK